MWQIYCFHGWFFYLKMTDKITMFEPFFIFDGKFYEQGDDVAVGSP